MILNEYTKFTKKINNFEDLFKYFKLGKYDFERYSKKVDMSLEFKNYNNLYDIFNGNHIDYQTLQDFKTFLKTR